MDKNIKVLDMSCIYDLANLNHDNMNELSMQQSSSEF